MKKFTLCILLLCFTVCLFAAGNKEISNQNNNLKVISLAPNVTEIICALDAEDCLVARTDYCNYPTSVLSVQSIGDMYNPNIEMIIALQPDAVIASSIVSPDFVEKLNNAGIKTYQFFHEYEGLDGTFTLISEIGSVIGKEAEAETLINSLKTSKQAVIDKVSTLTEKKKCIMMITWGEWGDYAATEDTFLYNLLETAGGINITGDAHYWAISKELLFAENPDVIFITDTSNAISVDIDKAFKTTAPYCDLKASINDNVYVLDTDSTTRQSVRLFDVLEQVSRLMYPELY